MKTFCSVVALCLIFSCATLSEAGRLERLLLQASPASASAFASSSCTAVNGDCTARSSVNTQAINDAAASVATSLATAIAHAEGNGNVIASANTFAIAIAQAYARIISSHYGFVSVSGEAGNACVFTMATGQATATAISSAVSSAFASSSNDVARAVANCFSSAVSSAAVTATQDVSFFSCVTANTGSDTDFFYQRVITTGFVQTVATAFSHVFTAIRDGNPEASAVCAAIGSSTTGVSTVIQGSG